MEASNVGSQGSGEPYVSHKANAMVRKAETLWWSARYVPPWSGPVNGRCSLNGPTVSGQKLRNLRAEDLSLLWRLPRNMLPQAPTVKCVDVLDPKHLYFSSASVCRSCNPSLTGDCPLLSKADTGGRIRAKGLLGASLSCCYVNRFLVPPLSG